MGQYILCGSMRFMPNRSLRWKCNKMLHKNWLFMLCLFEMKHLIVIFKTWLKLDCFSFLLISKTDLDMKRLTTEWSEFYTYFWIFGCMDVSYERTFDLKSHDQADALFSLIPWWIWTTTNSKLFGAKMKNFDHEKCEWPECIILLFTLIHKANPSMYVNVIKWATYKNWNTQQHFLLFFIIEICILATLKHHLWAYSQTNKETNDNKFG